MNHQSVKSEMQGGNKYLRISWQKNEYFKGNEDNSPAESIM